MESLNKIKCFLKQREIDIDLWRKNLSERVKAELDLKKIKKINSFKKYSNEAKCIYLQSKIYEANIALGSILFTSSKVIEGKKPMFENLFSINQGDAISTYCFPSMCSVIDCEIIYDFINQSKKLIKKYEDKIKNDGVNVEVDKK